MQRQLGFQQAKPGRTTRSQVGKDLSDQLAIGSSVELSARKRSRDDAEGMSIAGQYVHSL
jgi:hypothetical protein